MVLAGRGSADPWGVQTLVLIDFGGIEPLNFEYLFVSQTNHLGILVARQIVCLSALTDDQLAARIHAEKHSQPMLGPCCISHILCRSSHHSMVLQFAHAFWVISSAVHQHNPLRMSL
jgi:hypothetical protein